jgi:hypothetical protein
MAGKEVMFEPESMGRWLRARLRDEAEERRDGVEEVLIDARLAIALEVLSRAYAVNERRLFRGRSEMMDAEC